jgi:hypothetical protein
MPTPLEPPHQESPQTELVKTLPRATSPAEDTRAFVVLAIGLPTLSFLLAFLWALFRP